MKTHEIPEPPNTTLNVSYTTEDGYGYYIAKYSFRDDVKIWAFSSDGTQIYSACTKTVQEAVQKTLDSIKERKARK